MPDIKISNLDDVERLARLLVGSVFVPKDWNDKAPADQEKAVANTVGAILVAMSLGVPIIQGIRSISIIHGRPCMTAELMSAICMRQPDFEGIREWIEGSGEDAVAHCEIRRAKFGAIRRSFSMRDARRAGLADRDTWRKYPQRMLRARALAWACRDIYADVLCGLISAEEAAEIEAPQPVPPRPAPRLVDAAPPTPAVPQLAEGAEPTVEPAADPVEARAPVEASPAPTGAASPAPGADPAPRRRTIPLLGPGGEVLGEATSASQWIAWAAQKIEDGAWSPEERKEFARLNLETATKIERRYHGAASAVLAAFNAMIGGDIGGDNAETQQALF